MAALNNAPSTRATRLQVRDNLNYIASAPMANCRVTINQLRRDSLAKMNGIDGLWRGPDGNCIFTNPRPEGSDGPVMDRGGYADSGQRVKIVKQVYADGTEVPISAIRAAAAHRGTYTSNQQVVIWNGYNNNKRLTAQQVVLKVEKPDLFDRFVRWANGELDQSVTFMIGHRCGNGHLGCITGDHLFLVTGSANQSQRNCTISKQLPCPCCGFFPVYTECYCTKYIVNDAMPDRKCPICITCPPSHGRTYHEEFVTYRQVNQVLHTRLDDAQRRIVELESIINQMGGNIPQ